MASRGKFKLENKLLTVVVALQIVVFVWDEVYSECPSSAAISAAASLGSARRRATANCVDGSFAFLLQVAIP